MPRANGRGVVGTAGINDCRGVMGEALGAGAMTGSAREAAGVDGPARDAAVASLCAAAAGWGAGGGTGSDMGIGTRDGDGSSGGGVADGVLRDIIEFMQSSKFTKPHYWEINEIARPVLDDNAPVSLVCQPRCFQAYPAT